MATSIRQRLGNVGSAFKSIISGKGVEPTKKLKNAVGNTAANVIAAAASHPFLTAGVAAAGVTAIGAGAKLGATAAAGTTARTAAGASALAGASSLRTTAIAGGVGVITGALIGRGGGTQTQGQTTTPTLQPTQTTSHIDNSIRTTSQDQFTSYKITGSPGASIAGNPSQYASLPSYDTMSPYLSAPQTVEPSQSATQSQDWLLPALVIGAALIFSNR